MQNCPIGSRVGWVDDYFQLALASGLPDARIIGPIFFFFFTIQPQSQTDCAAKSGSHRNLKVGEARRHQVGRILSFLTLIRYRNVGGGG